jgi:nitronate monooxygenase
VMDAVAPIPVVAAGGIGDGRGLAGALAMGCIGVWCGTAFLATHEAKLDTFRKQRIIDAEAEHTRITRMYSGKTMRNITNELIETWEERGLKPAPFGLQEILIADVLSSARESDRRDMLMNAAGQISGMLEGIRPASEVVETFVNLAAELLGSELPANVRVSI